MSDEEMFAFKAVWLHGLILPRNGIAEEKGENISA